MVARATRFTGFSQGAAGNKAFCELVDPMLLTAPEISDASPSYCGLSFHIDSFQHTINILPCICKLHIHCISRIYPPNHLEIRPMLSSWQTNAALSRRPGLENFTRQSLRNPVLAHARKVNVCNRCEATNGGGEKGGPLRVIHKRFQLKKEGSCSGQKVAKFVHCDDRRTSGGRNTSWRRRARGTEVPDLCKRILAGVCNASLFCPYLTLLPACSITN